MKRALVRAFVACGGLVASIGLASPVRADGPAAETRQAPLPDTSLSVHEAVPFPTFEWALAQVLPSPELAFGRQREIGPTGAIDDSVKTAFGLRWEATPLLWSFGVHRSQPRWRFFIVDPFARQSGSLELSTSFEYIGGHVDRLLARPGLRLYLPVVDRGEALSVSLGTSVYNYDGLRVAHDVGAYVLAGLLGVQVTVAPSHPPLAAIATIRVRSF